MSDISCAKCGEPWDAYGVSHGDMEPEEAERFLNGEGCPSCRFGQKGKTGILRERLQRQFMESAIDSTDDPDTLLERWERGMA